MEAGRVNAVATGAANTPEGERVAELAAAETAAAAAAMPGPVTEQSAVLAADRGHKAAVRKSPPGAAAAANAGVAGAGAALLTEIDREIPLVSSRCGSCQGRRYWSMGLLWPR